MGIITMKKHYECKAFRFSQFDNLPPLIFDWDDETGEISGRDKDYFEQFDPNESLYIPHPNPGFVYKLGSDPFKSKEDMAAMIYYRYKVPNDLKEYSPKLEPPDVPEGCCIVY